MYSQGQMLEHVVPFCPAHMLYYCICLKCLMSKQAVRVATQYAPPLSPSPVGAQRLARRRADATQQYFPRRISSHADRCSRFTR